MKRNEAAGIAGETLTILDAGYYINAIGARVEIAEQVAACVAETQLITPGHWRRIGDDADRAASETTRRPSAVEVTDETTLAAARRLAGERPLVLNFASAKNPGGGFLGGSRAQEESLARSTALYPSLLAAGRYYDANRQGPRALYTDHAIFSPGVPVFRHDDGSLLDQPYRADFLTMPAANAGAMRQHGNYDEDQVVDTMRRRINFVLSFGVAHGFRSIVLGAWGCGAFGNDPELIAGLFDKAMKTGVARVYDRITFAVYDSRAGQPALAAFRPLGGAR